MSCFGRDWEKWEEGREIQEVGTNVTKAIINVVFNPFGTNLFSCCGLRSNPIFLDWNIIHDTRKWPITFVKKIAFSKIARLDLFLIKGELMKELYTTIVP